MQKRLEFTPQYIYTITMRTILHCDANNFYASVEMKLNPSLIGLPVAVSGNPEKRHGIILAKSNLAKACGVQTGETLWQAKLKCPNIVFVPPHYDDYVDFSNKLFDLYTEYTDKVEPFGIDECWLECTGSTKLFGSGEDIANAIRQRVKEELGITISVGVGHTKALAKLGSDYKKPDATTVINTSNYRDIVWPLPVSDLLMVGRKTTKLFAKLNIKTIGDLAQFDIALLRKYLGKNADKLYSYANGIEIDSVKHYYDKHIPESVGNSTTTPRDMTSRDEALAIITSLSEMVAVRLRRFGLLANGVGLSIRYSTLDGSHMTNLIGMSTSNAEQISAQAAKLLDTMHNFNTDTPIRQLGVSTYKLTSERIRQATLFDEGIDKQEKIEQSVDDIRKKYGYTSVQKGIVLKHKDICSGLVDKDFQPFKK